MLEETPEAITYATPREANETSSDILKDNDPSPQPILFQYLTINMSASDLDIPASGQLTPPNHYEVLCDGPHCDLSGFAEAGNDLQPFIEGPRYKCAICPDVDFCARCMGTPSNEHDRSHLFLKFENPVYSERELYELRKVKHYCFSCRGLGMDK